MYIKIIINNLIAITCIFRVKMHIIMYLYNISQYHTPHELKHARVLPEDIVSTFVAVVRQVLEYACQV